MKYLGIIDREQGYVPAVDKTTARLVEPYGFPLPVEEWATYVAIDENGQVYCYDFEPIFYDGDCQWRMGVVGVRVRYCGSVGLGERDWKETMVAL